MHDIIDFKRSLMPHIVIRTVLSRVHDNHHHPADVVGGALLGGTIASVIFGIWYVHLYRSTARERYGSWHPSFTSTVSQTTRNADFFSLFDHPLFAVLSIGYSTF